MRQGSRPRAVDAVVHIWKPFPYAHRIVPVRGSGIDTLGVREEALEIMHGWGPKKDLYNKF